MTKNCVSTIVDSVSDATDLATQSVSDDPAIGLSAVASLRALLDSLEELQVAHARAQGWSWQQIALLLGVSRQAVHKKYGGRDRRREGDA